MSLVAIHLINLLTVARRIAVYVEVDNIMRTRTNGVQDLQRYNN